MKDQRQKHTMSKAKKSPKSGMYSIFMQGKDPITYQASLYALNKKNLFNVRPLEPRHSRKI